jgi:hypothetical protein
MPLYPAAEHELEPRIYNFYRAALSLLLRAQVPFLVGGAYAFAHQTGIVRHTKDLDILHDPKTINASCRSFPQLGTELRSQIPAGSPRPTRVKTLST